MRSDDPEWQIILVLVRRAMDGDEDSFNRLVQAFRHMTCTYVARKVGPDEVQDIVQLTWIYAWTRIARLRSPAAFIAWILAIARNAVIAHYKKKERDDPFWALIADICPKDEDLMDLIDLLHVTANRYRAGEEELVISRACLADLCAKIRKCAERLEGNQRAVFMLHYDRTLDGDLNYDRDQAASQLGLGGPGLPETARTAFEQALSRARSAILRCLKKDLRR